MRSNGLIRTHGINSLKLTAAVLSGCAALLSILSFLDGHGWLREGLRSWLGHPTPLKLTVAWVGVTPAVDTAYSIGDTIHLAVTIADHNGVALVGTAVGWSSDDPAVALVDSTGTVVTRAPGVTSVTVSAEARSARSRILVLPRPRELEIQPADSVLQVAEGETRPIVMRARDARGHEVARGAGAGSWHSAAPDVATVDSLGRLVGLNPGRTTLQAKLGELMTQTAVEVVPVPASITLMGGADQRAPVAQRLPEPITVQVVSRHGRPIGGVEVRFNLPGAGGRVEPASVLTDEGGRARTLWTLGEIPGRQPLSVEVGRIEAPLRVVAEADPVRGNIRISANNDSLAASVRDTLPDPVAVRVSDSSGLALADVPVSWTVLDGGSITPLDARTDSLGRARARWTLGPKAGRQRARAQVGNARTLPPITLLATARHGPPFAIEVLSGDRQSGRVGSALPAPIALRLVDTLQNPVPGVQVHLQPSAGSVADTAVLTDVNGRVQVRWTMGHLAGVERLSALAPGLTPVEVAATAHAGGAVVIAFVQPPSTGVAGRALEKAVRLSVTDGFGNPVPGAPVVLKVPAGSVSPVRPVTDDHGETAVHWTLGAKAGPQVFHAEVKGTAAHAEVSVQARAAAPARAAENVPKPKPATAPKKPSPSPTAPARSPFGTAVP